MPRNLVLGRGTGLTEAVKKLMSGEGIEQVVTDYMVLEDLERDIDAVWNLLLLSGYLTVRNTLSYHDVPASPKDDAVAVQRLHRPERVYQAFVLGMLVHLRATHFVKSNRESGYGRHDVALIPRQHRSPESRGGSEGDPGGQLLAGLQRDGWRGEDAGGTLTLPGGTFDGVWLGLPSTACG